MIPCSNCGFTITDENSGTRIIKVESPFQHLFHNNDPPLDSEAKQIKDTLLPEAQKALAQLNDKIERLLAAVKDAEEERDEVQRFTDAHRAVIAPVRNVPSEIILEIFFYMREEPLYASNGSFEVFDITKGPWALSRICRRWRSAALSWPGLWDSMTMSDCRIRGRPPAPQKPVLLLRTALHRSAQHLLNVELSCTISRKVQTDLFNVLVLHLYRWQTATFSNPPHLLNRLARVKGPAASLEKLKFSVKIDQGSYETSAVVKAFEDAPRLRSVFLGGFTNPKSIFQLPWAQLTSIQLEDVHNDGMTAIIGVASALQTFTISTIVGPDVLTGVTITHESLRVLRILGDGRVPANFVFPGLEEVYIGSGTHTLDDVARGNKCQWWTAEFLVEFLRRSECSLKVLTLSDFQFAALAATGNRHILWQAASTLTELHIRLNDYIEDDDYRRYLKDLIRDIHGERKNLNLGEGGTLLPHLEVLTFELNSHGQHLSVDLLNSDFFDFIRTRWAGGSMAVGPVSKIRSVKFHVLTAADFPELADDDIQSMKRLQKEGLEISIGTKSM